MGPRSSIRQSLAVLALAVPATIACSGAGPSVDGGAIDAVDGAPDGKPIPDGSDEADAGPCPATPPAGDSPCPAPGLECTWGAEDVYACRAEATCSRELVWIRYRPPPFCQGALPSCPSAIPPGANLDAGAGGACTSDQAGLVCIYDRVAFTCANCTGTLCIGNADGGAPAWVWQVTPLSAGCPSAPVPNLGDACSNPGLVCDYDRCASDDVPYDLHDGIMGIALICLGGSWAQWTLSTGAGVCP